MGNSPGTGNSGLLPKIAVIAGIIAALATAVGVAWSILHKASTEVADHQNQVLATCEQVHTVLAKEHNEIFTFETQGGVGSPDDLIRVKKDVLLQVMQSNLDQSRASFDALNKQQVPDALTDKHKVAVTAQNSWYASVEQIIKTVRDRLPQNARVSKLNELGVEIGGDNGAGVQLNSAMTALAGKNCQVTA